MKVARAPSLGLGKVDPQLDAEETKGIISPGLQKGTIYYVWVFSPRFQIPLVIVSGTSPANGVEIYYPLRLMRGAKGIDNCEELWR